MHAGKVVTLIIAAGDGGEIGHGGVLPWHEPDDLKFFKKQTLGNTLIVGSKTFESLPKLEGRFIHVLSRKGSFQNLLNQQIKVFNDIRDAIAFAPTKEVFIGGGREVYKLAHDLNLVDRYIFCRIRGNYDHDTVSPIELPWV